MSFPLDQAERVLTAFGATAVTFMIVEPLKGTVRITDIDCMESEDPSAEPLARGARPGAPWWAGSRMRLALLSLVLVALLPALLATRWSSFALGGGSARARGTGSGCPGAGAPEVRSVPARDLPTLREALAPIMPPRVGRLYESGPITTIDLWSDNEPQSIPLSSQSPTPAAYELRWWALDRDGGEDDIAADVLEFTTHGRAQETLERAASPQCRWESASRAVALPLGAEGLSWVNADKAAEWDVLLVRGRRLYRIGVVPSGYLLTAAGPSQGELERRRAAATDEVLACALPAAGCATSAIPVQASGLASLPAATAFRADTAHRVTREQARSYAHAVNLRGYDVPEMSRLSGEGEIDPPGWDEAFTRCVGHSPSGRGPSAFLPAIHSPLFAEGGPRHGYQAVYSDVDVLAGEAAADRYIAMLASARARACLAHRYGRSFPGTSPVPERIRIGRVVATPLPSAAPVGYRGLGPYRATRLRLTVQASVTTRRGRTVRFPLYIESEAFVSGDALIKLSTESLFHPFPRASTEYLTSALLGRAEASSADLVG